MPQAMTSTAATLRRSPRKDPFRYGHRWVDGEMVPLTYADVLDPQIGDFIAENTIHNQLRDLFWRVLARRFRDRDDVAVWSDLKLRFGTAGKGPAPDVCVVEGVEDPERLRGSYWVGREPGRVLLVMEIVSRDYSFKDYRDVKETYQQNRIPEMILVDPQGDYLSDPARLSGYRLQPNGRYVGIPVRDSGLVSLQTDLRITSDPESWWGFTVVDLRTGERLLTPEEETEQLKDAEERAKAAKRQATAAKKQATAAKKQATAAKKQATAAEKQARLEAVARRAAEERAEAIAAQATTEREKLLAEIERLRASAREEP